MKNEVIVLAGGKGTRLNSKIKKQYIKLNQKDILYYSLEKFQALDSINNIIVVCAEEDVEYIKSYGFSKITKFAFAGDERMYSVKNALDLLDDDTDVVIVHDGVRPFFNVDKVSKLIESSLKFGGGIYAVKSTDTIKKAIDGDVCETINRENLYNVQTPQGFKKDLLLKSYDYIIKNKIFCTDDSMIVEKAKLGGVVKIIESDYENIKITTKFDLKIAEVMLGEKNENS